MRKKKKIENLKQSFGRIKSDSFNFNLIERYFLNRDNSDSFQVLSDKTCNDIDFDELFMFLDRTNSKVGQQYLYNRLRAIPDQKRDIELDETIINKLSSDQEFRLKTQLLLSKLQKDDAYYLSSLIEQEHIKPPRWFFLVYILSFSSLLSILLLPLIPELTVALVIIFTLNLCIHFWNKRNLYQYLGSIPQLLILKTIASKLHNTSPYKDIDPDLPKSVKVIEQVKNRMSFFQLEANLQSDSEALFWVFLEFIKIVFILEPLLLFGILKRLDTKRNEIDNVFCFVGHIDTLASIASLRAGIETYCLPNISNDKLSVTEIYHPLIENCVTNNIDIYDKSILLTGSNMSGKTSFIRTIGINQITGQAINTCFASKATIPMAHIYSAIRISDDLMNDKSYYFEEVVTIKNMIQKSCNNMQNIFLLDEIFKGTNTVERISAGKAVLSHLAKNNNIVFVSTHDFELTDMLKNEYDLYHFSEIVNGENVDFDYKLKEGKLKNRNAIRILKINQYPDTVIKEAITLSKKLDRENVLNVLT